MSLIGITGFVLGPVIAALFLTSWQIFNETLPDREQAESHSDAPPAD